MDVGLCTITNTEWPIEDVLTLASEAGYMGVEVWGKDHVGNPNDNNDPDIETCRAIADAAADLELDIPVYGSYLRAGTPGFRRALEIELDAAMALNADLLRVWPGEQEYGGHDSGHWNAVITDLNLAGQRAMDRDLAVTVEKHEGTLSNSTEGARKLIEAVDPVTVGLNWQPLFFLDSQGIRKDAEALAPLSNNVHLQATREHRRSDRGPLAAAYFDLPAILDVFKRSGFKGYVEVEFVNQAVDYEAAVRADREYLTEIALG